MKARPTGPLFDVPYADGKGGASDVMKKCLALAGLTRPDLFRDDAEHMPFTWHGLRHTAITHWAVAGRDARWLLLVAGHTSEEMTRRYLDKAAVVRGSFGNPHPELPPDVLADLLADLPAPSPEAPIEVPEEFRSDSGFLDPDAQSRAGNPSGLPAILTSHWRPQRESHAILPRGSAVAPLCLCHVDDLRRDC